MRGRALYTALTVVAFLLALSGAPSVRLAVLEAVATADADARYAGAWLLSKEGSTLFWSYKPQAERFDSAQIALH